MSDGAGSQRRSAGQGLIWGVGFNLGRDVIQFFSMLILVRLLTPQIYGQFALAQTIHLFLAVASFKTIAPFALQARDPSSFDWNTHFSAGIVLNSIAMIVALMIAAGFCLLGNKEVETVGLVLAVMAFAFPIEVMSTQYFSWLQAHHLWQRMRLLLLFGTFAAALISIGLAAIGAGVIALAAGNLIFVLPLIADYIVRKPFKIAYCPDWFRKYKGGRAFAQNRIASAFLQTGANLAEQSIISGIFGFVTLGVYTRSIGLAQITSGRIGPVVTQALYPVLTRAEAHSDRYRRFAGILFQGVLWISAPAAVFLGVEANNVVRFLYGEKWQEVIPLMGAAAALLTLRGLHLTMNQIMLANLQQKVCLRLDFAAAITVLAVIPSAVFLGPFVYLMALSAHAAIVFGGTLYFAARGGAIDASKALRQLAGCVVALALAGSALWFLPVSFTDAGLGGRIAEIVIGGVVFSGIYGIALLVMMPKSFAVLLDALPLPVPVRSMVGPLTSIARNKE